MKEKITRNQIRNLNNEKEKFENFIKAQKMQLDLLENELSISDSKYSKIITRLRDLEIKLDITSFENKSKDQIILEFEMNSKKKIEEIEMKSKKKIEEIEKSYESRISKLESESSSTILSLKKQLFDDARKLNLLQSSINSAKRIDIEDKLEKETLIRRLAFYRCLDKSYFDKMISGNDQGNSSKLEFLEDKFSKFQLEIKEKDEEIQFLKQELDAPRKAETEISQKVEIINTNSSSIAYKQHSNNINSFSNASAYFANSKRNLLKPINANNAIPNFQMSSPSSGNLSSTHQNIRNYPNYQNQDVRKPNNSTKLQKK